MQSNLGSSRSSGKIQTLNLLEFLFLGGLFYSLLALPLHIYIPYLSPALLFLLAIISFLAGKWTGKAKLFPLLVCATAGSHLLIQIFIHNVSVSAPYNYPFLFWPINAIVVSVLAGRAGFMKRLAFVMFGIGLALQFFAVTSSTSAEGYTRIALTGAGSGIDNGGDYGTWLAFCGLIFWLWGWKETSRRLRLFLWGCALLAVLLSLQTVSRTVLLSLSVAGICGLRGIPRKYWFRVVLGLGIIVALMLNFLPFFKGNIEYYQERVFEETGRSIIWRASVPLIQAKFWLGYGTDLLGGHNPRIKDRILPISSPHNPFILLWLGSGVFPVISFSLLWLVALFQSIRFGTNSPMDFDAFPLVVFGFIAMFFVNVAFADVWGVAVLAYSYWVQGTPVVISSESSAKYKQKVSPYFRS